MDPQAFDHASRPSTEHGTIRESRVRVIVEIPYGASVCRIPVFSAILRRTAGGPGHAVFLTFSGALFVAGGSAIPFGLAATQELAHRGPKETSNIQTLSWRVECKVFTVKLIAPSLQQPNTAGQLVR